jgi:hypothetical protein
MIATAAMNVTVNEYGNLFMLSSGSIKLVRSFGLSGQHEGGGLPVPPTCA